VIINAKEGLEAARAKGKQLARPKGPGKSQLDPYRTEIKSMIKNGMQKKYIAQRYGVSQVTVSNWLKKHGLQNLKPQF
jgi:DNA invertase Pin-like site-specific DNA recombinase